MTGQEPAARLGYTALSGGADGWISVTNTTPQRPFSISNLVAFSVVAAYPAGPVCELITNRLEDASCLVYLGTANPGITELAVGQAVSSVPITPTLLLETPDASLEAVKTVINLPSAVALVWVEHDDVGSHAVRNFVQPPRLYGARCAGGNGYAHPAGRAERPLLLLGGKTSLLPLRYHSFGSVMA